MKQFIKYVGLDVHKQTIAVSVAELGAGEARYWGPLPNTPEALKKLVKTLSASGGRLVFAYEAGPCGYATYRLLTGLGQECQVIAPALIPRKAGDRVKTDRRDSLTLARLLRAGELTAIAVPESDLEALRDLTRAREDMKRFEQQSRQRLMAFLLRHGKRYDEGKCHWTQTYWRWLETVKFEQPLQQIVLQEYIDTVKTHSRRVLALNTEIERAVAGSRWQPLIQALMALRGVNLLTATVVVAEIGDLRRFTKATQLMAYLGLVPSEHTSGQRQHRGGLTKTGNGHVRRVLVEAAWNYRHPARKTACLERRAEQTSEAVQAIAWAGQKRLCHRYRELLKRGKLKNPVCAAVARELTGFIWAIGQITASAA